MRKLQKEYQDTAEKIQSGEFDPSIISSKVPNPLHDEIRVKIIDNETALAIKKEELSRIKVELQQLNEIADIAPQVDIQLRDLSRDYEILQTNYQEFLERRESAAIAQAAGSINSTEFRIIDPPEVPLIPTGPLRSLFYLLVTFFAFAAGAAVAFLKSEFQDCFISLSDLRAAYGEKVLGGVSNVHSSSYQAETKRENIIFGSLAGGILGIGIMLSLISL